MGSPSGPVREREIHLPTSFLTFALRLQPFAPEFRRRSPVCSENDAFPERKGDLNFANEHRSAAKTMPGIGDAGTRAEIIVSLQTSAPSRKFRSPDRFGKPSFPQQTGAPSFETEPNGSVRCLPFHCLPGRLCLFTTRQLLMLFFTHGG